MPCGALEFCAAPLSTAECLPWPAAPTNFPRREIKAEGIYSRADSAHYECTRSANSTSNEVAGIHGVGFRLPINEIYGMAFDKSLMICRPIIWTLRGTVTTMSALEAIEASALICPYCGALPEHATLVSMRRRYPDLPQTAAVARLTPSQAWKGLTQ